MNRENIEKVRDLIASLAPDRFDMREPTTHGCGSPACIMGWAETLMQPDPTNWRDFLDTEIGEWLGLDYSVAHSLFYPVGGIAIGRGRRAYDATPAEAARVLDHLIATGKVDWSAAREGEAA